DLRRLVWEPLEQYLHGANTILISPDGALARFPFAAMPGAKPDTFLIEERAVAVVPVPRVLPGLLRARAEPADSRREDQPADNAFLIMGDVDFGQSPQLAEVSAAKNDQTTIRGKTLPVFQPLTGTRGEMLAVRDSYEQRFPDGKVRTLRGALA